MFCCQRFLSQGWLSVRINQGHALVKTLKSQWLKTTQIYFVCLLHFPNKLALGLCSSQSLRNPGGWRQHLECGSPITAERERSRGKPVQWFSQPPPGSDLARPSFCSTGPRKCRRYISLQGDRQVQSDRVHILRNGGRDLFPGKITHIYIVFNILLPFRFS